MRGRHSEMHPPSRIMLELAQGRSSALLLMQSHNILVAFIGLIPKTRHVPAKSSVITEKRRLLDQAPFGRRVPTQTTLGMLPQWVG